MTVVDSRTGEIVETIGASEARRLTTEAQNEFRSSADHFARGWALIEEAVKGGGHVDLGYRSPGDYLHAEFDGVLSGLDVAARRVAVRTMTDWGLSTRAIGKPLGVSEGTVRTDQKQVRRATHLNQTPAPSPLGEEGDGAGQTPQGEAARETASQAPEAAKPVERPRGEPSSAAPRPVARRPVTGIDGKSYTRPEPKPRAVPRRALPDQFFDAAYDAVKKVESLHRLIGDDRFPQNAEKVAAKHRNDLLRIRDLLEQVINSLPSKESTRD